MKDPDPALLERCQHHDAEAFAQLVAEQQDYIYTLARRVLRDPEEAADMTQEVLVKVWSGLPVFRGEANFRTWLYRIVVNHCLNRMRKLRREGKMVSLDEEEVERLPAWGTDPYAEVRQRERQALIWKKVEQLPTKYRLTLTLFYQQEMSCEEISDLLGVPVGTVKTHLFRGRLALANALPKGDRDVL